MADEPRRPRFRIRKLSDEEVEQQKAAVPPNPTAPPNPTQRRRSRPRRSDQPEPAPQKTDPVESAAPPEPPVTGGLFTSGRQVLALIGAIASAGLTDSVTLQRGPEQCWWSQMDLPWQRVANLVHTGGGRAFARIGRAWVSISPTSELAGEAKAPELPDVSHWEQSGLDQLLSVTALLPGFYRPAPAVDVIAPGTIARWALKRASSLGLEVSLVPVERRPLDGSGEPSGAILVRLRSARSSIPSSLVGTLAALPYTFVALASNDETRGLLIDVRHRLPSPPQLLTGMVPEGETWAIGPNDVGRWRLRPTGAEILGTGLLDAPDLTFVPAPAMPAAVAPAALPVRLVPSRTGSRRVDAVLLDDVERDWLRRYLATRPIGEVAFLLPGDTRHLLTAPGGLPADVPFGVPLTRLGSGGLFLEMGLEFSPPMPEAARQQRFDLSSDTVVAVAGSQAWRFRIAEIMPAWALWVGDVPPVQAGLSLQAKTLLARVAGIYREADLLEAQRQQVAVRSPVRPLDRQGYVSLLEEAMRADMAGNLAHAAELLDSAGYPGQAGRLYERAAQARS